MLFSDELLFLAAETSALARAKGDFARRVAVIVLEENAPGPSLEFLSKVLAAAQLNLNKDTLLAEIPETETCNIAPDLRSRQPRQILVFGLTPAQLGLSISAPLYQPFSFYGADWLFADRLSLLEPDKSKKSQLWAALQKMFLSN